MQSSYHQANNRFFNVKKKAAEDFTHQRQLRGKFCRLIKAEHSDLALGS
jgi:hypothetical protein